MDHENADETLASRSLGRLHRGNVRWIRQRKRSRPEGLAGHNEHGDPKKKFYGLGWSIQIGEDGELIAGHGGSLPGTNTQLDRRGDGRNFAILFNSRLTPHTTQIAGAALPQISAAIDDVQSWPAHNLFE